MSIAICCSLVVTEKVNTKRQPIQRKLPRIAVILPLWESEGQIIVAAAASLAPVDIVFGAGRILVWAEVGIGTAAHLLDTGMVFVSTTLNA